MMRCTRYALAAVFVVTASLVAAGPAQASEDSLSDAVVEDSVAISEQTGIPVEELLERHRLDEGIDQLRATVRSTAAYAGTWVTWQPLRYNIGLASPDGRDSATVEDAIGRFPKPELVQTHQMQWTAEELQNAQHEIMEVDEKTAGRITISAVDVEQNNILVGVRDARQIPEVRATLENADNRYREQAQGGMLRFEESAGAEPAYKGGHAMGGSNDCTASFVVQGGAGGSDHGVLSAAHGSCKNKTSYQGMTTSNVDFAYNGGQRDVSLHRFNTGIPQNHINAMGFTRDILNTKKYVDLDPGDPQCKQGRTTNQTCGTIQHTSVTMSDPYRYNLIWSSNQCQPGDSGGPVYHSNTAIGMTIGYYTDTGECIFGAQDLALAGTGWLIRTSPSSTK